MRRSTTGKGPRSVTTSRQIGGIGSPWKLSLWAACGALLLALATLSGPVDDLLRVARNNFHRHAASGDVVLVTIDNRSLREIGRWPWPRRYHAQLVDRLTAAGAKRILFDLTFETRSNPVDDQLLADAIQRSGRVILPVRGQSGPVGN